MIHFNVCKIIGGDWRERRIRRVNLRCPVAIIVLQGCVQYEIHMSVPILSRIIQKLPSPCLCNALVLCINWAHWLTAKDICGLMFYSRYNIISMTESYELV